MRLVKAIIFFALLSYCILFCLNNFERVKLNVPFLADIYDVPLFLIIIFSVILGVILGGIAGTTRKFRTYMKGRSHIKENKDLKKKIDIYETEQNIRSDIHPAPAINEDSGTTINI